MCGNEKLIKSKIMPCCYHQSDAYDFIFMYMHEYYASYIQVIRDAISILFGWIMAACTCWNAIYIHTHTEIYKLNYQVNMIIS